MRSITGFSPWKPIINPFPFVPVAETATGEVIASPLVGFSVSRTGVTGLGELAAEPMILPKIIFRVGPLVRFKGMPEELPSNTDTTVTGADCCGSGAFDWRSKGVTSGRGGELFEIVVPKEILLEYSLSICG